MMGNLSCRVKVIFSFQPSRTFHVHRECCPSGGRTYAGLLFGILLLLALPVSRATAQACFSADITRGCAPLTITLTDCSTLSNKSYNYGDGTVFDPNQPAPERFRTTSLTHTYTRPGRYTITQYGTKSTPLGPTGDSLQKPNYIEVLPVPTPSFTVNTCSGRNVRVQITDTVYESYLVNFGNGVTRTVGRNGVAEQTYADLSPQTITVTGQYNVVRTDNVPAVCGADSSTTVTPIVALPKPVVAALTVKDAATAEIRFDVQPQTRYRIEQRSAAGAYQTVATPDNLAPGAFTQSLGSLNTDSEVYTFRVTAFDACGNTLSSDEISTVVLNAAAADSRNEVNWRVNAGTSPGGFALFVNDAALTTLPAGQTAYTDNNVRCPEQYCYRAEAAYPGGAVSVSNVVCVNATSTRPPPALRDVVVTIREGVPVLSWTAPNSGRNEYFITRSTDGGAFTSISRVTEAGFTDDNARPDAANYCYRVSYTDACENRSAETAEVCPVRLNVQSGEDGDQLTWSPYREWAGGITGYVVEKRDAAGQVLSSENTGLGTSATDDLDTAHQVVRYRVRVTGDGLESFSNEVEVRRPVRVFLPDAFTPNGDGVNDVYTAKGLFIRRLEMAIYDRWGGIVFTSEGRENGWDGTINGAPAAPGTYVSLVRVTDQTGRITTRRSPVLLIR